MRSEVGSKPQPTVDPVDRRIECPEAIIVANPRSGTHLLLSALQSHPRVNGRGEYVLWCRRHLEALAGTSIPKNPALFNKPGYCNIAIVMYAQYELFERISAPARPQKILHLLRNPRDVTRSVAQMEADRQAIGASYRAHYRRDEIPPPAHAVSEGEWMERYESTVAARQRAFTARFAHQDNVMTLSYDRITQNRQIVEFPPEIGRSLLSFLGLEYVAMTTSLRKTGPQPASIGAG